MITSDCRRVERKSLKKNELFSVKKNVDTNFRCLSSFRDCVGCFNTHTSYKITLTIFQKPGTEYVFLLKEKKKKRTLPYE